jgi:peptidoglycan/xylan/chitin deacetylase (PgdA/CDA1 family)
MALSTRHLILAARAAALALWPLTPWRARWSVEMTHNFFWLYPTLRQNCAWHGPVATRFETEKREVWLTIDDGPDPRDTPGMLDALARYEAKATFFVIGRQVDSQRALVRRILREGHSLGNHTYSHSSGWWWAAPKPVVRHEIAWGNKALETATGSKPKWFRSPVGMNNMSVHPAAAAESQRVIGWSASGKDGCPAAPTVVIQRIMASVRPGAIILLHEGGASRYRVSTLERLLERLKNAGYTCVLPEPESLR